MSCLHCCCLASLSALDYGLNCSLWLSVLLQSWVNEAVNKLSTKAPFTLKSLHRYAALRHSLVLTLVDVLIQWNMIASFSYQSGGSARWMGGGVGGVINKRVSIGSFYLKTVGKQQTKASFEIKPKCKIKDEDTMLARRDVWWKAGNELFRDLFH